MIEDSLFVKVDRFMSRNPYVYVVVVSYAGFCSSFVDNLDAATTYA